MNNMMDCIDTWCNKKYGVAVVVKNEWLKMAEQGETSSKTFHFYF
jgi:hypothetical protein